MYDGNGFPIKLNLDVERVIGTDGESVITFPVNVKCRSTSLH